MSLLFGGGGKKAKPQFTGLGVQTSSTTVPVTLGWGLARIPPNIIWQGDFKAHKQKQKSGKGMGGSQTYYTYSGSYVLALGYGPSEGVIRVWKDQSKETNYAKLGFSFIAGNNPQAPWGYLTTKHPDEALGYAGIILMVVPNYDLGQSNILGQHSFETKLPLYNTQVDGAGDADPALVVEDFLYSEQYGVEPGFEIIESDSLMSGPDATTTGDAAFQTYCRAMGFGFSPVLDSQASAKEILSRWFRLFNTAVIWTGYSIRLMPYGSDPITAHGVTYLPDMTVRYSVSDADFIYGEGEDPIRLRRSSTQDTMSRLVLEVKNRENEYNAEPVDWLDQGLTDQFGPRDADNAEITHEITVPSIGKVCVSLIGQREGYTRNEWECSLPPAFVLLQPGDIIECNDPKWGAFDAMVIDIQEEDDDSLSLVVEEYNGSVSTAGTAIPAPVTNDPVNTGVTAGPVNTPILLQPPPSLTNGAPEVWAAVSGGDDTTADPLWGGAEVWISTDGGTSYNMVGIIDAPARMGKLSSGLAAYGGSNPDTGNTLHVNSAISAAEFTDATPADAAAGVTLSYIAPEGANVEEFLSYTDATLTGTDAYDFDDLYRGLNTSVPGAHGSGALFARLDAESVFKYGFPLDLIGETIYVKFVSFNIWSSGYQDIADCVAYPFTISNAYTYGTSVEDLNDVEVTSPPSDGDTLIWDTDHWEPGIPNIGPQPYGFSFNRDVFTAGVNRPIAAFDTPVAWTMPSGLPDCQGSIVDAPDALATAPSAQTDFDIQVGGVSVGTMRFAASALTATFIKASSTAVPLGTITTVVAPGNLNGMTGTIVGAIKGTRP